jgi:hypothetical protein
MPVSCPSEKVRLHGVVAHGLQVFDADIALAGLQHFLPGAVALHFGRRRVHAHQLKRDAELRAVVEGDFQHARCLVHREAVGKGVSRSSPDMVGCCQGV